MPKLSAKPVAGSAARLFRVRFAVARTFCAGGLLLILLAGCAGRPAGGDGEALDAIRSALAAGRLTEAEEKLDALPDQGPKALLLRGRLHLEREDWFKAEMAFYKARSRGGSDADAFAALTGLGEASLGSRNGYGARDRYEEARPLARTESDRQTVLVGLARAAAATGDLTGARRLRSEISGGAHRVGKLDAELAAASRAPATTPTVAPWRPDWQSRPGVRPAATRPKEPRIGTIAAPEIVRRSRWGARAAKRSQLNQMGSVDRITVHHTGEANYRAPRSYQESVARLRSIQGGHQARWADIGYHWVIDPAGRVFEGREERWQGAHAGNGDANRANVGVVLMGNFDHARPTAAQMLTLERTLGWLMQRHGVSVSQIHGHDHVKRQHGLGGTSCPGRYLERELGRIKRTLASTVAAR